MKFYCIVRTASTSPSTVKLLRSACAKQRIDFELVESDQYDLSRPSKLEKSSCLFSLSVDERSLSLFRKLLSSDTATIFKNSFAALSFTDNDKIASIICEKAGLPVIKSIYDVTREKEMLKNYVKNLGGFPIILKAEGGSHGVGVMKIDSYDSLVSVIDFLVSKKSGSFMLKQFIDYRDHARLIVLGDEVIGSYKYHKVKDDFRSNSGKSIKITPKKFSNEVETIAVDAVAALQAEFGSVDILIDGKAKAYLAEVNISSYIPIADSQSAQMMAKKLVKFLAAKADS